MIQVVYNGVALESLGDVSVSGPARSFEPAEAPQRIVNTLRIVIDLFSDGYLLGQNKVSSIVAALKQQQATLKWGEKGPPESDFVHRTVSVREADLPEDPNGWGTYHRRLVLVVSWVEALTDAQAANAGENNVATFQGEGSTWTGKINLPNIVTWQESMRLAWLHERRSQRDRSEGRVMVSGFLQADTSQSMDSRRASLLAARKILLDAMDGKQGKLERKAPSGDGGFSENVRIEDLTAEINQAVSQIAYAFTARYTRWPPENDYSTERFTLSEQQRREDGQVTVSFRGSIQSDSLAHARSRLDTLRTSVHGTYAPGTVIRLLSSDLDVAYLSSADDRISVATDVPGGFVELSFTETWLVFSAVSRELSLRYGIRRRRDLVSGREGVEVTGELFGDATTLSGVATYAAGNFLDAFYTAKGWTDLQQDDREISYEGASAWVSGNLNLAGTGEVHRVQRVAFSASWQARLPDEDVLLECEVTESVTYSGVRWVEHRRPDGASLFQNCGTESATRQVSGSVRSTRRSTCEAFAAGKRKLLESHQENPATDAFEDPPSLTTRFDWLPRLTPPAGIADTVREGAGAADVAVYTIEFRYQERMPERTLV